MTDFATHPRRRRSQGVKAGGVGPGAGPALRYDVIGDMINLELVDVPADRPDILNDLDDTAARVVQAARPSI